MKKLIVCLICFVSVSLFAQQDAMFTKYMFNSAKAPADHPADNSNPKNTALLESLQEKMKSAQLLDVNNKNAKEYGMELQLTFQKAKQKKSLDRDRKSQITKAKRAKSGTIVAASGKLIESKVDAQYTSRSYQKLVALINPKGQLLGAGKVVDGKFNIDGLTLSKKDSEKTQAVVFHLYKGSKKNQVFIFLFPIKLEFLPGIKMKPISLPALAPWQLHAWACESKSNTPYQIYRWGNQAGWKLGWYDPLPVNQINWGTVNTAWNQIQDLPQLHDHFIQSGKTWIVVDYPATPNLATAKTCISGCEAYCKLKDGYFAGHITPVGSSASSQSLSNCRCIYR